MPDRMITIGAQDAGAFELLEKIKQSSTDIYDQVIKKAEQYSSKLSEQAERAKNIIEKEKEIQRILAQESKDMLQSERDRKLAQLDPKDSAFSQNRKDLVNEYGDAVRDVNSELRDFNATMGDVSRKSSEHFQKGQEKGFMSKLGARFSQGAVAGGVTGFMTGGGLGGLAATLVGGGLGMIPMIGTGAAILGGGITGALFNQGQGSAEADRRLLATTGGVDVPNLAAFGMDRTSTMTRQRVMAQMAGNKSVAGSVGSLTQLELGMGMDKGALNQFLGLRGKGVKDDTEDLVIQYLTMAVASDIWNVKSGDFSVMPKRIADLSATLESATQVMVNPDAQRAIFLKTSLASMGELFGGGRGQQLMMGMHAGIQNPSNPFQNAMTLEAIMRANPEMGGGAVGLTRAKAVQARGIHGEGTLEAVLEQIRQSTDDPLMRQVMLVNRFEHLLPFFESKSLQNLVSSPSGRFAGKGADEISKLLQEKGGFSEENLKGMFNVEGATKTDQLNAEILTTLQKVGEQVTEGASAGILKAVSLIENTFLKTITKSLESIDKAVN